MVLPQIEIHGSETSMNLSDFERFKGGDGSGTLSRPL